MYLIVALEDAIGVLFEENIVVVEGRLSIREDEPIKIVANNIRELKEEEGKEEETQLTKPRLLSLNIETATEEQKARLRGAIKFFMGDKNNIAVEVIDGGFHKPCGALFLNEKTLEQFKEILGSENVTIN